MSYYLVLNVGSSSLKFSLYQMPNELEIVNGNIEKIGEDNSSIILKSNNTRNEKRVKIKNHNEAIKLMLYALLNNHYIDSIDSINGIGHRILHGGEYYSESVIIDNDVIENIKNLTKFGPLHHPKELSGINALKDILPNIPQVAVFDTSFHQTIPKENYRYGIPNDWYQKYGLRKYGFHGTSHKYITKIMQKKLKKENINIISCHLGSGASICAIKNGESYNTTMGTTPLDGLLMGTRCGSIDPSIIEIMTKETKLTLKSIMNILNNESGIKGIAGKNDMRDIHEMIKNGNTNAILAYNMLINSIVKYIAQYYFELEGKVDAIVFTAGMGENDIELRKDVLKKLSFLGININFTENCSISKRSTKQYGIITNNNSTIPVYVVPTNEEKMILEDTYRLTNQKGKKRILK